MTEKNLERATTKAEQVIAEFTAERNECGFFIVTEEIPGGSDETDWSLPREERINKAIEAFDASLKNPPPYKTRVYVVT